MGASDFLERELLDLLLSNAAYTPGATLYVSLHTGAPGDTGANECTAGNYARATVANNATMWPAATGTGGTKKNASAISFATCATAAWGTSIGYFAFWDALTAGNCLIIGTLTAAKSVGVNDKLTFPASSITVTIT